MSDHNISNEWCASLEVCLRVGTADESLLVHLDSILSWYSLVIQRDQPTDEWTSNILERYSDSELRKRFEDFLDRLVISNVSAYANLFSVDAPPADAKRKFRKLMSVFHPDKGRNNPDWLNFRAERINSAYKNYLSSVSRSATAKFDTPRPSHHSEERRQRVRRTVVNIPPKPTDWRSKFGSPAVLQRRALALISAVCSILIFSILAAAMING